MVPTGTSPRLTGKPNSAQTSSLAASLARNGHRSAPAVAGSAKLCTWTGESDEAASRYGPSPRVIWISSNCAAIVSVAPSPTRDSWLETSETDPPSTATALTQFLHNRSSRALTKAPVAYDVIGEPAPRQ